MCGIAGIASSEPLGERAVSAVKRMCDAMAHRGPDGEGTWRSPSGRCVLGHRRLVALDPSPAAGQPMVFGDLAITYNGEVYNFRDLRGRLRGRGPVFASTGDTEVVLRWLAERGIEGMF